MNDTRGQLMSHAVHIRKKLKLIANWIKINTKELSSWLYTLLISFFLKGYLAILCLMSTVSVELVITLAQTCIATTM